jgi:hypothetical protein
VLNTDEGYALPPLFTDYGFVETMTFSQDPGIDWSAVASLIQAGQPPKGTTQNVKRQSSFVDYGYCGGKSHSRQEDGMTEPSLLKGTDEEIPIQILQKLSGLIGKFFPEVWRGMTRERRESYANKLAANNTIEYLRLAKTEVSSSERGKRETCNLHGDEKNDPLFSGCVIFSKVIWTGPTTGERYSAICATRRSIGASIKRANKTIGPALPFVMDCYRKCSIKRRSISLAFCDLDWHKATGTFPNGLPYHGIPCHLAGNFYISPVAHYTSRLISSLTSITARQLACCGHLQ